MSVRRAGSESGGSLIVEAMNYYSWGRLVLLLRGQPSGWPAIDLLGWNTRIFIPAAWWERARWLAETYSVGQSRLLLLAGVWYSQGPSCYMWDGSHTSFGLGNPQPRLLLCHFWIDVRIVTSLTDLLGTCNWEIMW
jgi:hypothetical protein